MQYSVKSIINMLPGILLFLLIITIVFLLLCMIKILLTKRINTELLDGIACKDSILKEYSKIRHEYNNILQTLTFYIDEEDLEGLKEYKGILLEKTHSINCNSITPLAKIKDIRILSAVYTLYLEAEEQGIHLNITIYNDIPSQKLYPKDLSSVLSECLQHAYQTGARDALQIDFKISSNDNGLYFNFEHIFLEESRKHLLETKESKKNKRNKNIVKNTSLQKEHMIQEVFISHLC